MESNEELSYQFEFDVWIAVTKNRRWMALDTADFVEKMLTSNAEMVEIMVTRRGPRLTTLKGLETLKLK